MKLLRLSRPLAVTSFHSPLPPRRFQSSSSSSSPSSSPLSSPSSSSSSSSSPSPSSSRDLPPVPAPDPDKARHHDLTSFINYTYESDLSQASTTYIGTYYEYTVMTALARLGFLLVRTGGANDRGVDLSGSWYLPSLQSSPAARWNGGSLNVIIQCKANRRRPGPSVIRELQGTHVAMRGRAHVALLAAPDTMTKGVREALNGTSQAMAFVCVREGGQVQQLVWNQAAARIGLDGLSVGMRWAAKGRIRDVALTWEGKLWEFEGAEALKEWVEGRSVV